MNGVCRSTSHCTILRGLVVSNEILSEICTLTVEGRGSPRLINGAGNMVLNDQGYGTLLLTYDGEVQIGGKLAGVAQRLLDIASKSTIVLGLDPIDLALQEQEHLATGLEGK